MQIDKEQAKKVLEEIAETDFFKPVPQEDLFIGMSAIVGKKYADLVCNGVKTYGDFKKTVEFFYDL